MIKPPIVLFLSAEDMLNKFGKPYFGYTDIYVTFKLNGGVGEKCQSSIVNISLALPPRARASVLAHELFHANDIEFTTSTVLWREMRANWAGFKAEPLGFFQAIWLSISDVARLKLYLQRITKGF